MQIFHSYLRLYSTYSPFPGIFSVKWNTVWSTGFGFFSPCQTRSHKSAAGCYRGEMSEIFFMRSPVTECSWCVWSPGSLTSHKWPYQNIRETTFTWRKSLAWKKLLILKTQYQTQHYFLLKSSLKIPLLTDSMIRYIPKRLFLSVLNGITVPEIHSFSVS